MSGLQMKLDAAKANKAYTIQRQRELVDQTALATAAAVEEANHLQECIDDMKARRKANIARQDTRAKRVKELLAELAQEEKHCSKVIKDLEKEIKKAEK